MMNNPQKFQAKIKGVLQHIDSPKSKWLVIFVCSSLIILVSIYALVISSGEVSAATSKKPSIPSEYLRKFEYETIFPNRKRENALVLPGQVLSHESATIYPRRAGIIKDIYFDIGDYVEEGQVIGLLLPQGVEGQSAALIAEKQARLRQANANFLNSQRVSEIAIASAERQLYGGEDEYGESSRVTNAQKSAEVAKSNLTISEEALEKKRVEMESELIDAKDDVEQERSQIKNVVDSSFTPVDSMISVFSGKVSNQKMEIDDFPNYVGATDSSARLSFMSEYNSFLATKGFMESKAEHSDEDLRRYIESSLGVSSSAEALLRNSLGNSKLSTKQINAYLSDILANKNRVLLQKEAYEDAYNAYSSLVSSNDELLTRLENQVEKDQKSLEYAVDILGNVTTTARDNLSLVRAKEQQSIDRAKTALSVARASLNVEYSKSGHVEIVSPFSGVIAKRHILVGEVISMSQPMFELVGVETTLAKTAKQEIKFGVNEEYFSLIQLGDQIEFFAPQAETKKYHATVSRISPQVDPVSHNILVQAEILGDIDFPNHMSIRVRLPGSKMEVYQLPSTLIKEEGGTSYIWVLEGSTHKKLIIDVISEDGEFADVKGEIDGETMVIKSSPESFLTTEENDK